MITQSKKSVSPPTFWEKEPHWMEKRYIFQFKRTRALPASAGRERGARRAVLGALEGCAGRGGVGGAAGRGLAGGAAGHGLGRWLAARPGRGGQRVASQPGGSGWGGQTEDHSGGGPGYSLPQCGGGGCGCTGPFGLAVRFPCCCRGCKQCRPSRQKAPTCVSRPVMCPLWCGCPPSLPVS